MSWTETISIEEEFLEGERLIRFEFQMKPRLSHRVSLVRRRRRRQIDTRLINDRRRRRRRRRSWTERIFLSV